MSTPLYVLYLADVGPNYATFSVVTSFIGWDPDRNPKSTAEKLPDVERRSPDLCDSEKMRFALDLLDRGAISVNDWRGLYEWLGRGSGWATFTPESAKQLVSHWLSDSVVYRCVAFERLMGWIDFVDVSVSRDVFDSIKSNLVGPAADSEGYPRFINLVSNMVLTRKPVFRNLG